MGEFRKGSVYDVGNIDPSHIRIRQTIVKGEWCLKLMAKDRDIVFLACNNEYTEMLCEVGESNLLFNAIFGDFITRLGKAKEKYQGWIDQKNAKHFHSEEVTGMF